MAIKMAVVILAFVMGGQWGDAQANSIEFPLFTLIGSMLGVGLAIYIVIRDTAS